MVPGLRAMQRLPEYTGLANLRHTHLLPPPAFPPCYGPVGLSDAGKVGDPRTTPKSLPLAAAIQLSGSRRTAGYLAHPSSLFAHVN